MAEELHILEEQQAELIRRYKALRADYARLLQANEMQRQELIRSHEEITRLQQDYKQLQLAHALASDSPKRAVAKRKLTEMIHLIDKALQNVAD